MTVTTLVPLGFKNEHKKPLFTTTQNLRTYETDRVPPSSKELQFSGMANLKQGMEVAGISEKAARLIGNVKHKLASTQRRYELSWNKRAS